MSILIHMDIFLIAFFLIIPAVLGWWWLYAVYILAYYMAGR